MTAGTRVLALTLAFLLTAVACGEGDAPQEASRVAEPDAGGWKTWVLKAPEEINVPPPPAGRKAARELAEVKRFAEHRTEQMEKRIKFWGGEHPNNRWVDLNIELVSGGTKQPPSASRGYAYTNAAIYDAVVSTWHWKYHYNKEPPAGVESAERPGPDPSYPSEHAAIAGAASRVLAHLFKNRAADRFDQLAEEAAMSRVWAGTNTQSDIQAGLALGRAVAERVIARAVADGSQRRWDGQRPPGIGMGPQFWEPTPGHVTPPTTPLAGTWRTWIMESGSQFRPRPPSPYGSPELEAQAREVMEVTENLTPQQKEIATFWAAGQGSALPPGYWNQVAQYYAKQTHLDLPRTARLFALINFALADAGVAAWDAKFAWWSPRPMNVIRDLGLDADWEPLLETPSFPSYVSGHSSYSSAAAEVLAYIFPRDARVVREKADEAAISRLYGGIHFREDNDLGADMGRKIGRLVVEKAKGDGSAPVPRPPDGGR